MPAEDWYPEATHDPGLNAGYRRGRTLNLVDVSHETVGRDSRALIRDKGLAAWLFPKQGRPFQFAEANAVTSHACEWNDEGCGYEVERIPGEPMTPDQTYWIGQVVRWRHGRYGVPLLHHWKGDGRLPIGASFLGVADHGGLVHHSCDQHTDGWAPDEWDAIVGSSPPASIEEIDMHIQTVRADKKPYDTAGGAHLDAFPGATVLIDGAGPHGMHVCWSKEEVDRLRFSGVKEINKPVNRVTFFWRYSVTVDAIDARPKL